MADEFMDLLKEQINKSIPGKLKEVVIMGRIVIKLGYGENTFIDRSKTMFWVAGQQPFVKKEKKPKETIQLAEVENVQQETLF